MDDTVSQSSDLKRLLRSTDIYDTSGLDALYTLLTRLGCRSNSLFYVYKYEIEGQDDIVYIEVTDAPRDFHDGLEVLLGNGELYGGTLVAIFNSVKIRSEDAICIIPVERFLRPMHFFSGGPSPGMATLRSDLMEILGIHFMKDIMKMWRQRSKTPYDTFMRRIDMEITRVERTREISKECRRK